MTGNRGKHRAGNGTPSECEICPKRYATRNEMILHYTDDHKLSKTDIAICMDYAPQSVGSKITQARNARAKTIGVEIMEQQTAPDVCAHCGGVDMHYEDCRFPTVINDIEIHSTSVNKDGTMGLAYSVPLNCMHPKEQLTYQYGLGRGEFPEVLSSIHCPCGEKWFIKPSSSHVELQHQTVNQSDTWRVDHGYNGWVVWRGSWAFGEKFTISKDAINGLHQANELQRLLTERDNIQHQEIAAAQVELNAMRDRAIAAETELYELKLIKWEYIETADGHYARHKDLPGKTLGPMARRLAQAVVTELNR